MCYTMEYMMKAEEFEMIGWITACIALAVIIGMIGFGVI